MMTARLAWVAPLSACLVLFSASCSAGFWDAGKYTKIPDSCALIPPAIVGQLIGGAVTGERIDDRAVEEIQECSWSTPGDADHPTATFGQVTVYVALGRANSVDNGVNYIDKQYGKELSETGCVSLSGFAVDKSCVFPGSGISLVAFRKSNLFVRVTCSVRNPDACSGQQRSATAKVLARSVLEKL